jgi:hypothetical protein
MTSAARRCTWPREAPYSDRSPHSGDQAAIALPSTHYSDILDDKRARSSLPVHEYYARQNDAVRAGRERARAAAAAGAGVRAAAFSQPVFAKSAALIIARIRGAVGLQRAHSPNYYRVAVFIGAPCCARQQAAALCRTWGHHSVGVCAV